MNALSFKISQTEMRTTQRYIIPAAVVLYGLHALVYRPVSVTPQLFLSYSSFGYLQKLVYSRVDRCLQLMLV